MSDRAPRSGGGPDRVAAIEALGAADTAAARLRARARLAGVLLLFLAVLQALLVLLHWRTSMGSTTGYLLVLLPVFVLLVHAASRPVTLRHRRGLFAGLTVLAGVAVAVTVALGTVLFPAETWWWVGGALLAALPIAAAGLLDLRAARTRPVP